jgi:AcrR family transcriptional regulator
LAQKTTLSLRERRRVQTKHEIADVAIMMFDERSFDTVTIDEIAQAAGVSRATFFRHFAKKEDLFLDDWHEKTDIIADELRSIDPSVPIREALRRSLDPLISRIEATSQATLRRMRIRRSTSSLAASILQDQVERRNLVRGEIALRLGIDADVLLASVLTEATYLALNAAVEQWFRTDGTASLKRMVDEGFDILARGLDQLS